MPRRLSDKQACALLNDIHERHRLRKYIQFRSAEALADRFEVTCQTIYNAEKRRPHGMIHAVYLEIIRARTEYKEAVDKMAGYRLDPIAERHGVAVKTVCLYQADYHNSRRQDGYKR